MRSSLVVEASDCMHVIFDLLPIKLICCQMHQLQRSWVRSQHPSAQWNLRGGRWGSAEYSMKKKWKKSPPPKKKQKKLFFLNKDPRSGLRDGPWPPLPAGPQRDGRGHPARAVTRLLPPGGQGQVRGCCGRFLFAFSEEKIKIFRGNILCKSTVW